MATVEASAAAAPQAAPGGDTSAEAVLTRLEWTVIRRLDGLLHGDYRTLFRGHGMDLADLREYQLHDDVRHIDWNVTARLQQPYVRQFTEDRELNAWFLLDLSGSVDFGSARSKRAVSSEFVGVLARLLTRHGNRVGAVLYDQALDAVLPARSSRQHVLHLMQRMRSPSAPHRSRGKPTRLQALIESALPMLRLRSLVFVVSDFISEPGWGDALARLATRHEVTAVRLYDLLEMALPDLGLVTMEDAETGEQLRVDTSDAGFRQRFAAQAQAREEALLAQLASAGVDTLELATDADLLETLLRFAQLRQQHQRLTSGGGALPAHLRAQ
jgi:uncharacterized protein (DUF58 family)